MIFFLLDPLNSQCRIFNFCLPRLVKSISKIEVVVRLILFLRQRHHNCFCKQVLPCISSVQSFSDFNCHLNESQGIWFICFTLTYNSEKTSWIESLEKLSISMSHSFYGRLCTEGNWLSRVSLESDSGMILEEQSR